MRNPTVKQLKAVQNLVENGGNKSKALRDAGYSDSIAKNPSRVFSTSVVQTILGKVGFSTTELLRRINRMTTAKKFEQVHFSKNTKNSEGQLTDEDIREFLGKADYEVLEIVHGQRQRTAMCLVNDNDVQLRSAKLLLQIMGLLSPLHKGNITSPARPTLSSIIAKRDSDKSRN